MFIIAGTIAVTAAVVVRLIGVVQDDRPTSPPRSGHDLDRHSMRIV
jgi:hypothetical protein